MPKNQPFPTLHAAHELPGMALSMLGYTLFTVFDVLLKIVGRGGYPVWQIMGTVGLVCIPTITMIALLTGGIARLKTRKLKFHIVRGLVGLGTFTCGLYAITHIPLADCYGVIFASPIIMTVLSVVWLREHVGWPRWLAVIVGFIGVTIMLQAGASNAGNPAERLGYIAAFVCAVFNALSMLMVRRYGRDESNLTFSFYAAWCNLVVMGCVTLFFGWKPYALPDMGAVTGAGAVSALASIAVMTAFQRSPPAAVAPFQYVQILWGALFGYLIFSDIPTPITMFGAGLVIASNWFVLWREAKIARSNRRARRLAHIEAVAAE